MFGRAIPIKWHKAYIILFLLSSTAVGAFNLWMAVAFEDGRESTPRFLIFCAIMGFASLAGGILAFIKKSRVAAMVTFYPALSFISPLIRFATGYLHSIYDQNRANYTPFKIAGIIWLVLLILNLLGINSVFVLKKHMKKASEKETDI